MSRVSARSLLLLSALALLLASVSASAQTATPPSSLSGTPSATGPFNAIVEINGRGIHVVCAGSGGPTVLFDVGGPNSAGGAEVAEIAGNDVSAYLGGNRFCAYDRAGTGKSEADPVGVRTFKDSAADLLGVLAIPELGCPCVVIAESLGGAIAQVALVADPAGFAGLLLLDPAPPGFWDVFIRLAPADSREAAMDSDSYWTGANEEHLDLPTSFRQLSVPAEAPGIPIVIFAHGAGYPPTCEPCSEGYPVDELEEAWQAGLATLAESLGASLIVLDGVSHDVRDEAGDFVLDRTIEVIEAVRDPSTWATPVAITAT